MTGTSSKKEETRLANKLMLRMFCWKYLYFTPGNYKKHNFTVISLESKGLCMLRYGMEVQGYPF